MDKLQTASGVLRAVLSRYFCEVHAAERANNITYVLAHLPAEERDDGALLHDMLSPSAAHVGLKTERIRNLAVREVQIAWAAIMESDDNLQAWGMLCRGLGISPALASKVLQDSGATIPNHVAQA